MGSLKKCQPIANYYKDALITRKEEDDIIIVIIKCI